MTDRIVFVLFVVYLNIFQGFGCNIHKTCRECFLDPKDCVWCLSNTTAFELRQRCQPRSSDTTLCQGQLEIRNKSSKSVPESFNSNFSVKVQIKPQQYDVKLLPGQETTLDFAFQGAQNYPVDVYILADMSGTMHSYRQAILDMSQRIYSTLSTLTQDVRLGFGAFVDKNTIPYTITPDKTKKITYSFRHVVNATANVTEFRNKVSRVENGSNHDIPEGGFDALAQVLSCERVIGWREKARRIVVFLTNAPQHVAGDGRAAGIFEAYDGKCHTNHEGEYTQELNMDYPSIAQIKKFASDKGVTIIWTVPNTALAEYIYKEILTKHVRGSKTAILDEGNDAIIVSHLQNIYQQISTTIKLNANVKSGHADKFEIIFNPDCTIEDCKVRPEERKNFTVHIKLKDYYNMTNEKIDICFDGVEDKLTLNIAIDGGCACEGNRVINSPECNGGTLECGACICGDKNYGHRCKCSKNKLDDYDKHERDDTSCIAPNKEICSGNAGVCDCGQCLCKPHRTGPFCEEDRTRCPGFEGGIECNGHGVCRVIRGPDGFNYVCDCAEGWQHQTGQENAGCTCSKAKDACFVNSTECNNRGICECNRCICDVIPPWDKRVRQTVNCQIMACPECHTVQCDALLACVTCHLQQQDNCQNKCDEAIVLQNSDTEIPDEYLNATEWQLCKNQKVASCHTKFVYKYDDQNHKILVLIEKHEICTKEYYLTGGILLLTLLLVGIFTLLAWKCLTRYQDRKEFEKFEREHQMALSSPCTNPLYSEPRTFFRNPAFVASVNGNDN